MAVFGDTWFYVAVMDRKDRRHPEAKNYATALREKQVTIRWVLAEVANWFCAHSVRVQAGEFLQRLEARPLVRVIAECDDLYAEGMALYRARPDKEWSLTDCISFVVMEREGLREALTNDHHFRQAGFVPIFADQA